MVFLQIDIQIPNERVELYLELVFQNFILNCYLEYCITMAAFKSFPAQNQQSTENWSNIWKAKIQIRKKKLRKIISMAYYLEPMNLTTFSFKNTSNFQRKEEGGRQTEVPGG